ncbi:SCO family protein [Luteibacter aegosomatissinici]|uniref:SCO family protein n=1 Tax=Luteibacter aegosomatissinici TaxID=2911539 RepID=UPI001FF84A4A|nr:SCO family protein [Luteibacter aegosomatissinici]UPG95693.1 SCO family protein [Luteibacter aegosomatissinici]
MTRWLAFFGLLSAMPALAADIDVGGPFHLLDQDGHAVSDQTYRGQPLLMYFGYTSCPDVCPVDVAKIVQVARRVRGSTGIAVTPVFVTVDPARDNAARMKAYVRAFGPEVVGLTGSESQIRQVTDAYHVYFNKVPAEGGYLMDHSTVLYLVGADGTLLDHYGRKLPEQDVAARVAATLEAHR